MSVVKKFDFTARVKRVIKNKRVENFKESDIYIEYKSSITGELLGKNLHIICGCSYGEIVIDVFTDELYYYEREFDPGSDKSDCKFKKLTVLQFKEIIKARSKWEYELIKDITTLNVGTLKNIQFGVDGNSYLMMKFEQNGNTVLCGIVNPYYYGWKNARYAEMSAEQYTKYFSDCVDTKQLAEAFFSDGHPVFKDKSLLCGIKNLSSRQEKVYSELQKDKRMCYIPSAIYIRQEYSEKEFNGHTPAWMLNVADYARFLLTKRLFEKYTVRSYTEDEIVKKPEDQTEK